MKYSYLLLILLLLGCDRGSNSYEAKKEPFVSNSYIFAMYPYRNTEARLAAYTTVVNYIESHVDGVEFVLEASNEISLFEDKVIKESVDFVHLNPYQAVMAQDINYTVLAMVILEDEYCGVCIARKDSPIKTVEDLKYKKVSFASESAFAGTLMPKLYMYERGVDPRSDIRTEYVGSHVSSILNVYMGKSDAACVWNTQWIDWVRNNPKEASEMKVLWKTDSFATGAVMAHKRIPKEVRDVVGKALVEIKDDPVSAKALEGAMFRGFDKANDATFEPIRQFLKNYDEKIGLPTVRN